MMQSKIAVSALLFVIISMAACGGNSDSGTTESYEVKGRYLSTDMGGRTISVVHETVPDVMNAMRMSFRITDEPVVEELETGDIIRFDMTRTDAGWYARNITVLPDDTNLDLPEDLQNIGRR